MVIGKPVAFLLKRSSQAYFKFDMGSFFQLVFIFGYLLVCVFFRTHVVSGKQGGSTKSSKERRGAFDLITRFLAFFIRVS